MSFAILVYMIAGDAPQRFNWSGYALPLFQSFTIPAMNNIVGRTPAVPFPRVVVYRYSLIINSDRLRMSLAYTSKYFVHVTRKEEFLPHSPRDFTGSSSTRGVLAFLMS